MPSRPLSLLLPPDSLRGSIGLPQVSEVEVVRHYTALSRRNFGVDSGFYPLGSCTMKHNPKVNEVLASHPGFASLHPLQPEEQVQGALRILYELERALCEIGGMARATLQPAAGAHGELTAILMAKAFLDSRGDTKRRKVLVPDSSHGTNPATASRAGLEVVHIGSGKDGLVHLAALEAALDDQVAVVMLTNPNTLGLFESDIQRACDLVHQRGALAYCDGANLNAILGVSRPGDLGFDAMHFNLHKTFSTPHGGGGPGAGPVAVAEPLVPFLPVPTVERRTRGGFFLDFDRPNSIGRVHSFYGNFAVCVRALAYIVSLGGRGLQQAAEDAVLNARYLRSLIEAVYEVPYPAENMHEFVVSARRFAEKRVKALDIAKRLMDFGFHPPTMYFPLIVPEALMIEPTDSETRQTLEAFAQALLQIADEAKDSPELLLAAPHTTPVRRVNEVEAARTLRVCHPLNVAQDFSPANGPQVEPKVCAASPVVPTINEEVK